MPDSSGNFRGIAVPELPWRKDPANHAAREAQRRRWREQKQAQKEAARPTNKRYARPSYEDSEGEDL